MAWRVVIIPKCSNTGVSGKVNYTNHIMYILWASAEAYVETFEGKITEVWGSRRST